MCVKKWQLGLKIVLSEKKLAFLCKMCQNAFISYFLTLRGTSGNLTRTDSFANSGLDSKIDPRHVAVNL